MSADTSTWTECDTEDSSDHGGGVMPFIDQTGDFENLWKMGDTARCASDVGPVNFVMVKLQPNTAVHICNVGIFSCSCSDISVTLSNGGNDSAELNIDSA